MAATLKEMLSEQEFSRAAGEAIEELYRKLAAASDDYDFDVDMNAGALTVEFEEPRERFVVSPNSPVRQIWVSAHVKSYKLDWNGSAFVLEDGRTLEQLIVDAIRVRIPEFAL
ncbi:MAG: iron donor protein CyaY [Bryobacteraceae bacterium]